MNNVAVVLASVASFARDYGEVGPKASTGLGLAVNLLLVAAWLLSLFIAYLIVRAGVRAGVQVLVDQGRANRELLQAQNALLSQLVKRETSAISTGSGAEGASAWDKLRNQ
jgi:hypothetical protein